MGSANDEDRGRCRERAGGSETSEQGGTSARPAAVRLATRRSSGGSLSSARRARLPGRVPLCCGSFH
jgi:hypothetical protein